METWPLLPTSSRRGTAHRRLPFLSRRSLGGTRHLSLAALLWWDDEQRRPGWRQDGRHRVGGVEVVGVAVVLGGDAVVRLPAVALVLPLLRGQDTARVLHRVVVRLLDLRLHVVEVLRTKTSDCE